MTIMDNRVVASVAPGIVPDFFNNGVGFMNDGSIAIDDAAPAGDHYFAGYRRSAAGALHGVDFLLDNSPVAYIQGLPVAVGGVLIFNLLVAHDVYVNGNPVRNNSNAGLCII
jgi:hypothetical protein